MVASIAKDSDSKQELDRFPMIMEGAERQFAAIDVEGRYVPRMGNLVEGHPFAIFDGIDEPNVSSKQISCHLINQISVNQKIKFLSKNKFLTPFTAGVETGSVIICSFLHTLINLDYKYNQIS